eukprot:CAMPEP_0206433342 /NCGR_PEP_ID=MMETSP0324_2-20121206/8475_1 /ASSEMBLY_ACC=CAM_ASM_000836 /TAXON_ID=2866 /ORGANISM="Crypthecodinium cohnii, Strain Seligo" /LENGTH=59 /DNA_ID=CAMNT_0053899587 /DNA_START=148 /DNA_END=327 /DNA_ORIENTATION=-
MLELTLGRVVADTEERDDVEMGFGSNFDNVNRPRHGLKGSRSILREKGLDDEMVSFQIK